MFEERELSGSRDWVLLSRDRAVVPRAPDDPVLSRLVSDRGLRSARFLDEATATRGLLAYPFIRSKSLKSKY